MKKKIALALCLSLVLTSCSLKSKNNDKSNSNELKSQSNTQNNLIIGESKDNKSNNLSKSNEKIESPSKTLSIKDIKKAMVDLGGFDQAFTDKLSDKEIKSYQKDADQISKKTGFWNKLTLMFNQIAKENPNTSRFYPDSSIEDIVNNWVYSTDEGLDHYANARVYIGQNGFDASQVPNGELRKIFNKVYDENKYATYDENIEKASQKLKKKYPNGYEGKENSEKSDTKVEEKDNSQAKTSLDQGNRPVDKFSENKKDYDAFRKELVDQYKFSKKSVEKITNNDIDLAYLRAQKKLEDEGFGDIGLVINEIAKMYPGSSSMYPGNEN